MSNFDAEVVGRISRLEAAFRRSQQTIQLSAASGITVQALNVNTTGAATGEIRALGDIYTDPAGDSQGFQGYASGTHIFSLTRQTNDLSISGYASIGLAPGATSGPSTSYRLIATTTAVEIEKSGNSSIPGGYQSVASYPLYFYGSYWNSFSGPARTVTGAIYGITSNSNINPAPATQVSIQASSGSSTLVNVATFYGTGPTLTAHGGLNIGAAAGAASGVLSMAEITAPSAPAANGVYIYAEDNGAGKTRLMARFNTGVAQQIAIQP